jgi:hypothetical protein
MQWERDATADEAASLARHKDWWAVHGWKSILSTTVFTACIFAALLGTCCILGVLTFSKMKMMCVSYVYMYILCELSLFVLKYFILYRSYCILGVLTFSKMKIM